MSRLTKLTDRPVLKNIIIQLLVFLFSTSGVFLKLASNTPTFSPLFILYYCVAIAVLFIYAVFWQQILRITNLSVAYSHRATSSIWVLINSAVIFHEQIKPVTIIAVLLIVTGIVLVSLDEAQSDKDKGHGKTTSNKENPHSTAEVNL
ncbi:MAG: DMT family transporter [Clostridiaceae bacterium]|nr:DMT family transporter [Clostridiaceae bacterium]